MAGWTQGAKSVLEVVYLAIVGLVFRLRALGPLKLAIAGSALALAIAIPVVVIALNGDKPQVGSFDTPDALFPAASAPEIPVVASPTDLATPTPEPTPAPTPTPTPAPHPSNMIIMRGVEAPVVAEIQERLMELNYMERDEPTEYFGNITEHAVILFQRQHDLDMDGKVGMETYELLMSDRATKYTVMHGASGEDVTALQRRLRDMLYMDEVTGFFGDTTEAAVKRFQERNGLTADGKVGAATREALYSPSAKGNLLYFGENSDKVKQFQQTLKNLGYLTTTPDGNYGGDTKAAVTRFQEINGLIADGFLGYDTMQLLKSGNGRPNGIKLGMKGADVTNVQKLLKKLGYMNETTGYYGEITESAVKAFQKNNKLGSDGIVGKATMTTLTSTGAKKASSSGSSSGGSSSGSSGGSSGGSSSSSSSGVDRLISTARSKLGSAYVYATKGPNTFDCSGFVYYCLNQSGVSAPYMTSAGWQTTGMYQRINSMSDLKRGDILSFNGHVGIYLGGGEMIDASSSQGKVRITSNITGSSYWTRNFVCGYRVF